MNVLWVYYMYWCVFSPDFCLLTRSPVRRSSHSWLLRDKCVEHANLTALSDTACPAPCSTWPNLFTFTLTGSPRGAIVFDTPMSVKVCLLCMFIRVTFSVLFFVFYPLMSPLSPLTRFRVGGRWPSCVSPVCNCPHSCPRVFKPASPSLMCQAVFCESLNPLCAVLCVWWMVLGLFTCLSLPANVDFFFCLLIQTL